MVPGRRSQQSPLHALVGCLFALNALGCPLSHPAFGDDATIAEEDVPEDAPDVAPPDTAASDTAPDVSHDAMPDAAHDAMPDAVHDAMPDAVHDAMPDAAHDAMLDAALDAPHDVALDAPRDVALDAPRDVALDAPRDVALDVAPDAPRDVALDAPHDVAPDAPHDVALDAPRDVALDAPHDVAPDAVCDASLAWCDGRCVNTRTDNAHCGACGRSCSAHCVMGQCVGVVDVSTGNAHTCAVLDGGALRCWGHNGSGRVGDGTTTDRNRPTQVTPTPCVGTSVGLGFEHSCVVCGNGSVRCWGVNASGQLGNGSNSGSNTPVVATGVSNVVQVVGGNGFTCARRNDRSVRCWGRNEHGQLGNDSTTPSTTQVTPMGLMNVVDVAAGSDHTCAALMDGSVWCWGSNNNGQLGRMAADNDIAEHPTQVAGISDVLQVETGNRFTCALRRDSSVWCWGANANRQLGRPETTMTWRPAAVTGLANLEGHTLYSLSCGGNQCCVVVSDGSVRCWGANMSGQLGDGMTTNRAMPVIVPGITDAVQVSTRGNGHTCVRSRDGAVRCWGANMSGQLGDGTTSNRPAPTLVEF